MYTPQQEAWLTESKRRVSVLAQRLRDRASAEVVNVPLPILPPDSRDERAYLERECCRTCGRNLRRTESQRDECWRCQSEPAPLTCPVHLRYDRYGCGCIS